MVPELIMKKTCIYKKNNITNATPIHMMNPLPEMLATPLLAGEGEGVGEDEDEGAGEGDGESDDGSELLDNISVWCL